MAMEEEIVRVAVDHQLQHVLLILDPIEVVLLRQPGHQHLLLQPANLRRLQHVNLHQHQTGLAPVHGVEAVEVVVLWVVATAEAAEVDQWVAEAEEGVNCLRYQDRTNDGVKFQV